MSLAIVDASVLTAFYVSDDPRRHVISARLASGDALYAPAHLDVEIVSALRGIGRVNAKVARATNSALTHLAAFPIRRMPIAPLLQRIWQLRSNVSPYDAAYIALAEQLQAPLITSDARLAKATGVRCTIELIN